MKWKPMSEMTFEEVKNLLKDILEVKKVKEVIKNEENNTLAVTIVTEWNTTDDEDKEVIVECEDEIELTPNTMRDINFSTVSHDYYKYKQYMIAKGYSEYWKDNPYV